MSQEVWSKQWFDNREPQEPKPIGGVDTLMSGAEFTESLYAPQKWVKEQIEILGKTASPQANFINFKRQYEGILSDIETLERDEDISTEQAQKLIAELRELSQV